MERQLPCLRGKPAILLDANIDQQVHIRNSVWELHFSHPRAKSSLASTWRTLATRLVLVLSDVLLARLW
jgi:hypothetical protein